MPLRVSDFEVLADSGAFVEFGKTELLDGEIYVMNSQWSRHARAKSRLYLLLGNQLAAIGSELEALVEVAVRVADDSMPEPDITLTRWRGDRAVPADTVALLVEVSDTTLDIDLGRKVRLYAAARIPEYWVVDVNEGVVLAHTSPNGAVFAKQASIPFGARLTSATIAGLTIDTTRLLD